MCLGVIRPISKRTNETVQTALRSPMPWLIWMRPIYKSFYRRFQGLSWSIIFSLVSLVSLSLPLTCMCSWPDWLLDEKRPNRRVWTMSSASKDKWNHQIRARVWPECSFVSLVLPSLLGSFVYLPCHPRRQSPKGQGQSLKIANPRHCRCVHKRHALRGHMFCRVYRGATDQSIRRLLLI